MVQDQIITDLALITTDQDQNVDLTTAQDPITTDLALIADLTTVQDLITMALGQLRMLQKHLINRTCYNSASGPNFGFRNDKWRCYPNAVGCK